MMTKRYYLQHCYKLNHSSSKSIFCGISIKNDTAIGELLIFGESGGITLSGQQFLKFLSHGEEIYNFLCQRTNTKLNLDLSDDVKTLTVKSRIGKCTMLCFSQVDNYTKLTNNVCLAQPSLDQLFGLQHLIMYYMEKINDAKSELDQFICNFKPQIESGNINFKECESYSNALDWKLLLHELCCFKREV